MKKIIVLTILTALSSLSLAQNGGININNTNGFANNKASVINNANTGVINNSNTNTGVINNTNTNTNTNGSSDSTLDNAMNQAKSGGGDFNSRVPNPFVFCSAPKPGKYNPLRPVWEQIFPAGNAQAAPAPVPVPTGKPTTDTKAVQEQFNKLNSSN